MAQLADDAVERVAKAILSEARGRASAERERREAVALLEREQAKLEKLIEILDPFEPAAQRRIAAQTAERDDARERVGELSGFEDVDVIDVSRWDELSVDVRDGRSSGRWSGCGCCPAAVRAAWTSSRASSSRRASPSKRRLTSRSTDSGARNLSASSYVMSRNLSRRMP
jgi:hypothetical protein